MRVLVCFRFANYFKFYVNVVDFVLQERTFLLKKKSLKQLDLVERIIKLLIATFSRYLNLCFALTLDYS